MLAGGGGNILFAISGADNENANAPLIAINNVLIITILSIMFNFSPHRLLPLILLSHSRSVLLPVKYRYEIGISHREFDIFSVNISFSYMYYCNTMLGHLAGYRHCFQ